MTQGCSRSPFSFDEHPDEPWVLWEQEASVLSLLQRIETDGRYPTKEHSKNANVEYLTNAAPVQPMIQRNQYHAVLSRMKQATSKTSSYSSWTE